MRPRALDDDALARELATLPLWRVADGKLRREFRFRDFSQAFGFMARAALVAERMDHHPEWTNVYSLVRVDLVTHDAKGITTLDVALARAMDAIASDAEATDR